MNFTIPATTPPGKYLARVEHFFIQSIYNTTQQYINCAHMEIIGPGGGTPGPTVKFPGAYSLDEPGKWMFDRCFVYHVSADDTKAFGCLLLCQSTK